MSLPVRYADPLKAEVIVMDVHVPSDVFDPKGYALGLVKERFVESQMIAARIEGRDPYPPVDPPRMVRCIQIHIHYGDEIVVHSKEIAEDATHR